MKKKSSSVLSFATLLLATALATSITTSCSKDDDPVAPVAGTPSNPTPSPGTPPVLDANGLCVGDSVCSFPFKVMPYFVPSGYYDTADPSTTFDFVGTDNKEIAISYTVGAKGYWGAAFLNANNWAAKIKMSPKAKKISFSVRTDYSQNVTFNAFGGTKKLSFLPTPLATPVWENIVIDFVTVPTTFNSPLSIVIDGKASQLGLVTKVDIKDIQIIE